MINLESALGYNSFYINFHDIKVSRTIPPNTSRKSDCEHRRRVYKFWYKQTKTLGLNVIIFFFLRPTAKLVAYGLKIVKIHFNSNEKRTIVT